MRILLPEPGAPLFDNAYPNPATDLTTLNFNISKPSEVTFEVYNLTGELLNTTSQVFNLSGPAEYTLDVNNFTSGLYMVVIKENNNRMISTVSVK